MEAAGIIAITMAGGGQAKGGQGTQGGQPDPQRMRGPAAVRIFVRGIPRPAGSKRPVRNPYSGKIALVDSSGQAGKVWSAAIRLAAAAKVARPLSGPVWLRLTFFMPRPKAHYRKTGLKPDAPLWHAKRPDLSKLIRAVEDALTGVVWRDDRQVTICLAVKRYGETPGVEIVAGEIKDS